MSTSATPLDLTSLLAALGPGQSAEAMEAALAVTWRDPSAFRRALWTEVSGRSATPLKSDLARGFDLYHDLVVRNLGLGRVALVHRTLGGEWQTLGFDLIHERAGALTHAWREAGVVAGDRIAVVSSDDAEVVTTICAALRSGLVLSVLPPWGPTFVENRLKWLAPKVVIAERQYEKVVAALGVLVPPPPDDHAKRSARGLVSHTYAPTDPVLAILSPYDLAPAAVTECPASEVHIGALRDAKLIFGVGPKDRLAAPGFDPMQHQPWLYFAAWMGGGAFVAATREQLADLSSKKQLGVTIAGLTPAMRDLVLQEPAILGSWRKWWKSPAEPYEWELWERMTSLAEAEQCLGFNVIGNAAHGGALLFSPPRAKATHLHVYPAPGAHWELQDVNLSEQPSTGDHGLFASTAEGATSATCGHFLLSRTKDGYFFSGSLDPGTAGRRYPSDEIVALAEAHELVDLASVAVVPGAEHLNKVMVNLMVFVDPELELSRAAPALEQDLRERIAAQMHSSYQPTAIYALPLFPRLREGRVDHDWCRFQLTSGLFGRRARDPFFRTSSALRRRVWLEGK